MKRHFLCKALVLTMLILCFVCATGCEQKKPLEIGFECTADLPSGAYCAVKSEKSTFQIDDVTLDFYLGKADSVHTLESQFADESYKIDRYAVYFSNNTPKGPSTRFHDIADFPTALSIEPEVFYSEDYSAQNSSIFGKSFKHSEPLLIPAEFFDSQTGYVIIKLCGIFYSETEDQYMVAVYDRLFIGYRKETNEVTLFEADFTWLQKYAPIKIT